MDSIKISSGTVSLKINEDENRVISFNPNDLRFTERYYNLLASSDETLKEYEKREAELDKDMETDAYGIPKNMPERFKLLKEVCDYVKEQIDIVFGAGTSETAFGDEYDTGMFDDFFEGITPYIQKVRNNKIAKYTAARKSGALK